MRDWWGIPSPEAQSLDHVTYTKVDTPIWLSNFFAVGSLPPSSQFNALVDSMSQNSTGEQQDFGMDFIQHEPGPEMNGNRAGDQHVNDGQWALPELQESDCQNQQTVSKEFSSLRRPDQNSSAGSPDSTRTKFEVQIHRSLPHVLMPPLPQDVYVHEIIERARSNTLSRRMLLDAPTLADFLVDNPNNVLSSDLKKFLEPVRRSRRTAEYLGTYWVSYLLLRVSTFLLCILFLRANDDSVASKSERRVIRQNPALVSSHSFTNACTASDCNRFRSVVSLAYQDTRSV